MNRLESETNTDLRQEKEKKSHGQRKVLMKTILMCQRGNGREPEKYFKQIKRWNMNKITIKIMPRLSSWAFVVFFNHPARTIPPYPRGESIPSDFIGGGPFSSNIFTNRQPVWQFIYRTRERGKKNKSMVCDAHINAEACCFRRNYSSFPSNEISGETKHSAW